MAARAAQIIVLVVLLSIVTICCGQAETSHGWGRPPAPGALSKYDSASKTYAWVARDKCYEYYRFKLAIIFGFDTAVIWTPFNSSLNLQQSAIHAKVVDVPTGAEVGVFDSTCTFTAAPPGAATIGSVCQGVIELGPEGNDSLAWMGSADVDIQSLVTGKGLFWTDVDFTLVGGTGRFTGAFGKHKPTPTGIASYEALTTAYVPRVRDF